MSDLPFTWLDIGLFAVMLISGLLALMRGFTREVLSIVSWLGAAVATFVVWFNFPGLHKTAQRYIQPDYLADIVLGAATFVIVLIVLSALTARLSDRILDSEAGAFDRTLGFVFGVVRGLALMVIAFVLFAWLVPRDQFPSWVRSARTLPMIASTSNLIISYLPKEIANVLRGQVNDTPQNPAPPAADPKDQPKDSGYTPRTRRGLNQLVEGTRGAGRHP
jgi:membrane protein required for colicin V production